MLHRRPSSEDCRSSNTSRLTFKTLTRDYRTLYQPQADLRNTPATKMCPGPGGDRRARRAGPMGQCYPLPADPLVRAELGKHTRNHLRIWNMFNFARRIRPGTDMWKARSHSRSPDKFMGVDASRQEHSGVAVFPSLLW